MIKYLGYVPSCDGCEVILGPTRPCVCEDEAREAARSKGWILTTNYEFCSRQCYVGYSGWGAAREQVLR